MAKSNKNGADKPETETESTTADDPKHPVGIRNFTRNLKVTLNDREIVERAQRASQLGVEIEQREEEIKAARKLEVAKIDELKAERRRLDIEVNDGATHREVNCQERKQWRLGKVVEVRLDTEEVLSERPMTDRERQVELPQASDAAKDDPAYRDGLEPLPTEKPKRGRKRKGQDEASAGAE